MRLIPIVALVNDEALAAIAQAAAESEVDGSAAALTELCSRNGWTIEALIAGQIIINGLPDAMETIT
jgi:hypothetical protein